MYPPELEIKDTTESNTSASPLDLLLSIGRDGQLRTSLYDKRNDFNFHITDFPFLSSNIPSSPAYCVFIPQLIRYARACSSYECFILSAMRLSNKLLGLLSYTCNIIRSDMNFLTSSPKSAPSKIKTQKNGITCMQLNSPKVHLCQTIHDWHRPLRIVRLFMHLLANAPQWRVTCPTNRLTIPWSPIYISACIYTLAYTIPVCWTRKPSLGAFAKRCINAYTARCEGGDANRVLFEKDAPLGK